jgi:hypothetical protein
MRYSPPTYPDHGESNTVKKCERVPVPSRNVSNLFYSVPSCGSLAMIFFHQVVFYNHFYNCKLYDPHPSNVQCNFIVSDCKKVIAILKRRRKPEVPCFCHMDEDSGALGPLDHDVRDEPVDVLQENQLASVPDMSIVIFLGGTTVYYEKHVKTTWDCKRT